MKRIVRRLVVLCIFSVVSACAVLPVPTAPPAAPGQSPDQVARTLQQRYDDARGQCGDREPAFVCSGLLMRSTNYSDSYYSWRPNPANAPWGVNMSWLRQDSNYADSFPSGNGFVIYPPGDARRLGLKVFEVRCVYPRDAWSTGPDRCQWHQKLAGPKTQTPLCYLHVPPILDARQWVAAGYDNDERQCAFATDSGYAGRAEAWRQMIEVRRLQQVHKRNELVVDTWVGLDDRLMPIEAFFYRPEAVADKPDPLAGARADQRDFMKLTGRWVPVIRWDPSDAPQGGARFSYRAEDQLIAAPGGRH